MSIRTLVLPTITLTGAAGSGAGTVTASAPINGSLLAIKIVHGNTPHANTDTTITISDGVTTQTLLTLTNNNTASAWYNVRAPAHGQTGTALVFAGTDPVPALIPLDGVVTVTVAEGGSASTCAVTFRYES